MARKKGSANLAASLEVLAGAPLDARSVVDSVSDLTTAATFSYYYEGMPVYVKEESKMYVLSSSDPTDSDSWKEVGEGSGGGGASALYTGTLLASGWSNKTQTVSVSGIKASDNGTIGLLNSATSAQIEAARNAVITVSTVAANAVTFACEEVPSIDIPFGVVVGGGGSGSADFPSGGTTGQALVKKSNADNDVEWGTINSIPNGGTTGQVLAKKSNTDKDVEWVNQIDTQKEIKDNGTAVTDRDTINFTDFDISDDSTNAETDIKAHRLTAGELAEICSTLPGAPTQYPKYSTTEQVVGEWIDGKPLYQRTVDIDLSQISKPASTASTWVGLLELTTIVSDIDLVFITDGSYFFYNNTVVPLTCYQDSSANIFYMTCIAGNKKNINVKTNGDSWFYNALGTSNSKFVVTIQYTKNTV